MRRNVIAILVFVVALLLLNALTKRPWGCSYFTQGWYSTAQEINSIETALTKMRLDASIESLQAFFDSEKLNESIRKRVLRRSLNAFDASVEVYTALFTALLEDGRAAREKLAISDKTGDLARVLNPEPLKNLAVRYSSADGDSWGGSYSFFLGPWPQTWGPILFRKYRIEKAAGEVDPLTLEVVKYGEIKHRLGCPADTKKEVYIWSPGPNGVSDQPIFDPNGKYEPPLSRHYRANAPPEYLGGGDDINNWDPNFSWGHLHREHLR